MQHTTVIRRHISQLFGVTLVLALTLFWARAAEPPQKLSVLSAESQATYEKQVLPFLKQHCWKCHDKDTAKKAAGFQVDTLGTDFLEGKTANHWREAIDQINLGKMPKSSRKLNPKEAFAVVEWVNLELRNAEKRAQSTGGRIPMRRLNRSEYANTVRDLFHLDEEFARRIERELPADGKVDGFDRGGVALFIDKAQLQAYLAMAQTVVEEALPAVRPKTNTYLYPALKNHWLLPPAKKKTKMTMKEVLGEGLYAKVFGKEALPFPEVDHGPTVRDYTVIRDGGLEMCMGQGDQAGVPPAWPHGVSVGEARRLVSCPHACRSSPGQRELRGRRRPRQGRILPPIEGKR